MKYEICDMRKKYYLLFVFLLLFFRSLVYAQQHRIDSLLNSLNQTLEDTTRIRTLNRLASEYNGAGDYEKGVEQADKALELSEKYLEKKPGKKIATVLEIERAKAYNNIGIIYKNQGNYPKALESFFEGLKFFEKVSAEYPSDIEYKKGVALIFNSIGNIYANQLDYSKALENYSSALKISEESGDKTAISKCLNNIGVIYDNQGQYAKALDEFQKSLIIKNQLLEEAVANGNSIQIRDGKKNIAYSLNNLGNIYAHKADSALACGKLALISDNYSKALDYYFQALKIREEVKDKKGKAISMGNIGDVYASRGDSAERTGNKSYAKTNYSLALTFHLKTIAIGREMGAPDIIRDASESISNQFEKLHLPDSAFFYYKLFISTRDTLLNAENTRKTVEAEMTFNFDKKAAVEKAEQEKKDVIAAEKFDAEKRQRNYFIFGFGGMLLLSGFIFRSYRQKKKANEIIAQQKILVEEKQKEVLDSIQYAKRIQQSLLPTEKYIDKNLERLKTNL